jgi:hypothetical protein
MFYSKHQLGFATDTHYVECDILNEFVFIYVNFVHRSQISALDVTNCSTFRLLNYRFSEASFPRAEEEEDRSQFHVGYQRDRTA